MESIEERLQSIGYGRSDRSDCCWRAIRLDRSMSLPPAVETAAELACSRELLRWRAILAHSPRPSPYRVSRA
jgi:hypothetical protein